MFAKAPLFLTICLLLAPATGIAQDAPDTSVVILPTKAKGGPNLKGQVRKRVEKKLKGVKVVPFKTYRRAAKRAGIKTVVLPARNRKDLSEVPQDAVEALNFEFVDHVNQVLRVALDGEALAKSNSKRR